MKKVQLFDLNKVAILGSDGVLNLDGRYIHNSIIYAIEDRNKRVAKNFPHLVAGFFQYTDSRYNPKGSIFPL